MLPAKGADALKVVGITVGGAAFFVASVGVVLGPAFWNAKVTPALPWFPLLSLAVVCGCAAWLQRRVDIGLRLPPRRRWPLLAAFGAATMIFAHAVLVLEGAAHGITREFEAPPPGVTPFFAAVYWAAVVVGMSTASEVAYRGIMQTRLAPLVGTGWAVAVATFVNLVMHRWDGLPERAVGVVMVLLGWSWLRHLSGSTIATIVCHIATIAAWDAILWTFGPWDHAAMDAPALALTAAIGLAALAASVWLARRLGPPGPAGGGLAPAHAPAR